MFKAMLYRLLGNKYRVSVLKKQGAKIGNNCIISPNVSFGSEPYLITVGNDVKFSNGVTLVTHDGGIYVLRKYKNIPDADVFGKIRIGNNVFLGNKSVIMPNVEIGDNCVIGYGAIVTKNVPSGSVVAGVPARVIKNIDEYYQGISNRILNTKNLSYPEKKERILDFLGELDKDVE